MHGRADTLQEVRMSLSFEIIKFLAVASVYIGFTFVWAWYKGRQEDTTDEEEDNHADVAPARGDD